MSVVEPPIIVAEDRAVALFDPAAEAESYLKPVDVTKGVYRGYDAMGRLLKIETDRSGVRIRAKVHTSDGFRAAVFGLSGDLWRSVRGLGLRRRGN